MNILYIEDNHINRLVAKKMLSKNYTIDVAETAQEAFDLLTQKTYQVFLIDINLNDPNIDGFGVLSYLKSIKKVQNAIFIAHTSYVGDDWEEKCLSAGFHHYLPKPLDVATFAALIGTA